MQFQSDANIVVYNTSDSAGWTPIWANERTLPRGTGACDQGVGGESLCTMNFQGDGNLVTYVDWSALWASGTEGVGSVLSCIDEEPWMRGGNVVWDTNGLVAV